MVASDAIAKPVRAVGGFYSMALDTFVAMFRPPFAWREFISQSWFVARVSILPTLMLTIPYTVLLTFTFNILLREFGAADFSGTGAALSFTEDSFSVCTGSRFATVVSSGISDAPEDGKISF